MDPGGGEIIAVRISDKTFPASLAEREFWLLERFYRGMKDILFVKKSARRPGSIGR